MGIGEKDTQGNETYVLTSWVVDGRYLHKVEGRRIGEGTEINYFEEDELEFKKDKNLIKIVREIKHNSVEKFTGLDDD